MREEHGRPAGDADDDAGRRPGRPAGHGRDHRRARRRRPRGRRRRRAAARRLGGGSNLVVADEGFAGTVVRVATTGITVESDDHCGGANVRVAAGERVGRRRRPRRRPRAGRGSRRCRGSPGSTGATPIQNVGAYGQEVAQTIAQVRVWDRRSRQVRTLFGVRLRVHLPPLAVQARPDAVRRARRAVPAAGRRPLRAGPVCRPGPVARGRARHAGAARRRPRGRPGAAAPARDGARRRRPRHVELRVVLHQPDPLGRATIAALRRPGPRPARRRRARPRRVWPEPDGRRQDQRRLADRAGRVRQGLRDCPARPRCPTSTPWR